MPMPLGSKHSEETKIKMSLARIGKPHPMASHVYNPKNLGKKHSIETRKKMSDSRKGINHPLWKGGISLQKDYDKNWKLKNKEHVSNYLRCSRLKSSYGISIDEYNKMLDRQKGGCAVCGEKSKDGGKLLAVDHNHLNGKVRGLLCSNCNTAIGLLRENTGIMVNLIKYLYEHINLIS